MPKISRTHLLKHSPTFESLLVSIVSSIMFQIHLHIHKYLQSIFRTLNFDKFTIF